VCGSKQAIPITSSKYHSLTAMHPLDHLSSPTSYVFDPTWEVEKMPGPRCIFDGVLLPNGHVVLLGGQRVSWLLFRG
jgi:hypothetical protein